MDSSLATWFGKGGWLNFCDDGDGIDGGGPTRVEGWKSWIAATTIRDHNTRDRTELRRLGLASIT